MWTFFPFQKVSPQIPAKKFGGKRDKLPFRFFSPLFSLESTPSTCVRGEMCLRNAQLCISSHAHLSLSRKKILFLVLEETTTTGHGPRAPTSEGSSSSRVLVEKLWKKFSALKFPILSLSSSPLLSLSLSFFFSTFLHTIIFPSLLRPFQNPPLLLHRQRIH